MRLDWPDERTHNDGHKECENMRQTKRFRSCVLSQIRIPEARLAEKKKEYLPDILLAVSYGMYKREKAGKSGDRL